MTGKHYRWQTRWRVDRAAGEARHDSGLVVRFDAAGAARAVNADEVRAQLAVKHGHNAPQMIARMLYEAALIYDSSSDGRRG